MDEAAAPAITVDGAEKRPDNGDGASENDVCTSAEDTADRVGSFCCQDCGEAFKEEAPYLEHRHQHLQESMYLDDRLDGLNDVKKDSEAAHFCTLCSLSFVEASEFDWHMKKNHGQTSQQECITKINSETAKQQTYECPDCGKCYGMIGHFLNHQRSHRQASKSVFHDLEHLKKKSFQCESCGRNYSRASALDAHRRCHEEKLVKSRNRGSDDACHTEEPIVESKPIENQSDDTPERLFKCSCGKAFTALVRLKTHQRFSRNIQCSPEEMKEKPKKSCSEFYCNECNKSFSGHIALINHQRWHANHSNDTAKRFSCEECGKVFMTLTFYYRHQRMVHSDETPAKSFLHQVCQLQKKAFECKDCGLKFSRASALHSHQLHHTDVFRETEKEAQMHTSLIPQQKTLESEPKETEQENTESENLLPTGMGEDVHADETDEESESYEPGDFNVQVISASESEDEPTQDLNPDLELLCESDQEVRDDDTVLSPSNAVSKPEMDLKIVQIDFELADVQCAPVTKEVENKTTVERFDCPECYRWFTSSSSLRVHRMWHGVRKRRQQTQVDQSSLACKDCGLRFTHPEVFENHLHQHALEEEEGAKKEDNRNPAAELDCGRIVDEENGDGDTGDEEDCCEMSSSLRTIPQESLQSFGGPSVNKDHRQIYSCLTCGKVYTYLVSFRKHQQLHENQSSTAESLSVENVHKYECSECGLSFVRRARLLDHLKVHQSYRPFKTRPPRCDQFNKDFTSTQSGMAHADVHEQKPFWCLSCAKGFFNEQSLDLHLQSHNRRQHVCNICHKSFHLGPQLWNRCKAHSGAKPYQCTLCGKRFSFLGNLISHRKKHKAYAGSNGMSVGIKNSAIFAKKQMKKKKLIFTNIKEEPDTNMVETPLKKECMERSEHPCENVEFEDHADTDESDCGEPMHRIKPSKPPCPVGSDPPDESKTVDQQAKQELGDKELEKSHMHREHKYWEWECCECDMGFDEVAKLHLHYIKHATGELPIPQDGNEGSRFSE